MPFNNDVFFKYSLLGDNEQSKILREGIVEEVLGKQVEELYIVNPNIVPDGSVEKEVRGDISV